MAFTTSSGDRPKWGCLAVSTFILAILGVAFLVFVWVSTLSQPNPLPAGGDYTGAIIAHLVVFALVGASVFFVVSHVRKSEAEKTRVKIARQRWEKEQSSRSSELLQRRGGFIYCAKCGTKLPDDAQFCSLCGQAQQQQTGYGTPSAPFETSEPASRDASGSVVELEHTASDPMKQHEYEKALIQITAAINLQPTAAMLWCQKGLILAALQRQPEAAAAYERALALTDSALRSEPDAAHIWELKAGALYGLERYAEAVVACERALQIDPSRSSSWVTKASALGALGRYDAALAELDHALELEPNEPSLLMEKQKLQGRLALSKTGA